MRQVTVYFSIIRKPYSVPLNLKRYGNTRAETIASILLEFPDALIEGTY